MEENGNMALWRGEKNWGGREGGREGGGEGGREGERKGES